jgi:hypothetical protein
MSDKKLSVEERLAAMEEEMGTLKDENEALKLKIVNPYENKDGEDNGPGNPNVMLYKGKKHKQFHPADVKKALKDGWKTDPDESFIRKATKE